MILTALALGGAAVGGGVAYLLTRPATTAEGSAASAAAPSALKTVPNWSARVSLVAGDGFPGSTDGPARRARFGDPFGVVIDGAGNAYVADGGSNNSIRKITADGVVSTLAGSAEGYAEGTGKLASFNTPSGLAIDKAGNLYVADTGNNAIRKVTPAGLVSTLAGDGLAGSRDGHGAGAQFNGPLGVAVDSAGVVYVADTYNDRIRRIATNGEVTTLAGGKRAGNADGTLAQALFDMPASLAVAANGDLYIADAGNNAIRKISNIANIGKTGHDGQVSTVAVADDKERAALLRRPMGLALSGDGYLYVGSAAHGRLAQVSPAGVVTALVDVDHMAQPGFGGDGSVRLYQPRGIALARDGSLLVSDAATFRLHRVAPPVPGQPAPPEPALVGAPSHSATMLWPVKPQDKAHEVVGLMGEVRGNFDGDSRDHFHAGMDVQAAIGTPVLAMLAAKVGDPLAAWGYGELSEGLMLDGMRYIHMRVGRGASDKVLDARFQVVLDDKGKPAGVRVKRGTRFDAGETLGTVNRMAHVHLDYLPNGDVLNPLTLPFVDLQDTIAPQVEEIALIGPDGKRLKDRLDGRLKLPRSLGQVQIVVDAFDQIDGNQARRRLGLYKLGYQLLDAAGVPVPGMEQPRITQLYDRLPRNREAVKLAYAEASGITVFGSSSTRFVYALNNALIHGKVTPGTWKILNLAPGNYTLRILAEDYAGNAATKNRDLPLQVE